MKKIHTVNNSFLLKDRKIRFNEVPTIILIPSRKDLLLEDYSALWWSRQDFISFKDDGSEELQQFIKKNIEFYSNILVSSVTKATQFTSSSTTKCITKEYIESCKQLFYDTQQYKEYKKITRHQEDYNREHTNDKIDHIYETYQMAGVKGDNSSFSFIHFFFTIYLISAFIVIWGIALYQISQL
jgi:hypothetical protein